MKVLICSDKYKGSIGALEVCKAIESGLHLVDTKFECTLLPLADGGDGTGLVLSQALDLKECTAITTDPLGRTIKAKYYYDETTAYVELAEASGMWRLTSAELDVMTTTTVGTGELINHAISSGFTNIVLCLGGSCTNEMGLGIAYALGFRFFDAKGNSIVPAGGNLTSIKNIVKPKLKPIALRILCDVSNPLYGPQGAAHIYGKQKGADERQIAKLDEGVKKIADYIGIQFSKQVSIIEGAGAAGGVAAGLYGLMDEVVVENGFDYLSSIVSLPELINKSDVVITGEGRLDSQSLQGKVVGKVAALCKDAKVPVVALVGRCDLSLAQLKEAHILLCDEVISLAKTQKESIEEAEKLVIRLGERTANKLLSTLET